MADFDDEIFSGAPFSEDEIKRVRKMLRDEARAIWFWSRVWAFLRTVVIYFLAIPGAIWAAYQFFRDVFFHIK